MRQNWKSLRGPGSPYLNVGGSPSLDVIRAEIWPGGEIIPTNSVVPVWLDLPQCHKYQSVKNVLYHTAQGILSSSCELISRQTHSFSSHESLQRIKDQNCFNACGIFQGVKVCTIKSGPAWTWSVGCYLGKKNGPVVGEATLRIYDTAGQT